MQKAMEKYKPQMDQAAKDIHTEMERIGNIPEARDTVMEGLMGMGMGINAMAGRAGCIHDVCLRIPRSGGVSCEPVGVLIATSNPGRSAPEATLPSRPSAISAH